MRRTLGNGYDLPPQHPLPKLLWWSNCRISQMRKPMVLRGEALEQVRGRAGIGSQAAASHPTHIHGYNWSYSLSTQPCEQPGFGDISVRQHPGPHKWAWGVETALSSVAWAQAASHLRLSHLPHARVSHRAKVRGHRPGGRCGAGGGGGSPWNAQGNAAIGNQSQPSNLFASLGGYEKKPLRTELQS